MLTKNQIKKILPYFHANSYKGICTKKGVWKLSRMSNKKYEIDIDLKEAMRETGKNYRIIRKWNDDFQVHIKYEVLN